MRRRVVCTLLTLMLTLSALAPSALAATQAQLDDPAVFLKEQGRGTCTLVSAAMMLRRAALLRGDADWAEITEASCRSGFWIGGRGLPNQFSFRELQVERQRLPGGQANRQVLIDALAAHPEGVVLHASRVPHGVLLTHYADGVFYCADPSVAIAPGLISIENAWGTRIENSSSFWYVTTPLPGAEAEKPEATAEIPEPPLSLPVTPTEDAFSTLAIQLEEPEESTCLIYQALTEDL